MAMHKRILSAALALVLLLSCVPMTALATETEEPAIVTEEPAEPTEAPAEEEEEPSEAPTEAPAEEPEEPAAPTEEPVEETTAPTEATEAPAEEPTEPVTEPIETEEATAAQEAVDATTSGTCGDDLTWTFDDSTGTLTISGTGKMEHYTSADPSRWGGDVKTVLIEPGVTSVGIYAFAGCSNLTSVTIPEGVTIIDNYAFSRCSSLTSIAIPSGVTSIGYGAFNGCSSLVSIVIPDSLSFIGVYAFQECSSLTSFTIPDGVTTIRSSTFYGCSSLANVSIPDSVTEIESSAFSGCSSLTSITIPDSITAIDWFAFFGCSSLTSVTIPAGITSIESGVFCGCSGLTSITIPEGVTTIGSYAFEGCTSLPSITIPEGVTSIGKYAFYGCKNLTSIIIPEGVTSIEDNTFVGCSSLTSITIPEGVSAIGNKAFNKCTSLISITFSGNAPQIGEGDGENVFYDVATIAYYPANNPTWTADVMQDYGGTITWVPYGAALTAPAEPYKVVNVATGIQVYWNKVSGASKYGVWRSEAEGGPYTLVTTATSTLYTDTKVAAGTTYYYRITAMNASGAHSEMSDTVSITFVTAPKVVAATSGAYAYWEAIPGATKYGVWCSKNGANGNFELLGTTTATNYTNRNVPSGSTYYYAISIVDANGNHSALSKSINHTFLSTPTSSVSNVATGVKVSWNRITGALGYAVYRKTYTSSVWTRVHTVKDGDTLSWTDESVRAKNGQGYHYTVRALAGSKLTIQSAQRINGTPIVRLTSQTLKSAVKVSATAIKCTWSTSTVVAGYEVRLMTGGTVYKTYKVPGKTTASKALTGLPRGKTYTVQIRTYATLGTGTYYSAWSNAKSVTLP